MRDKPFTNHKLEWPGGVVPEWARPKSNPNKRFGKGRGGKAPKGGGKRERLQKVMAQSGHGSRRNIEILIAQGHITINGQLAKLGDSVGPGDKVKLDGHVINLRFGDALPRVLLYHKPDNEIVTRDDPEKRATVFDKLPKVNNGRWVSVGRLDLNTSGLLIFTTSGELAERLTHPRFEVEREYAVRVMGELTQEQKDKLLKTGVDIDGENCLFDSIDDRGGEGSNHWYHVVLREGKNREVRRMMEAVGLMVSRLMRVRFGSVELPTFLKRNMFKEMEEEQVQELLAFAGVNEPPPGEEGEPEEEDEDENIGNRIDAGREARRPAEPDDDFGNRIAHQAQVAREAAAQREADGNRGTYGEGPAPRGAKQGPRRAHGQGKPFGKKPRGERDGNVAAPQGQGAAGPRHGAGQGHGGQGHGRGAAPAQGKRPHQHRKPKPQGQPPAGNAAQAGGNAAHAPRPQGQGQGQAAGAGAAGAAGPGQGKPGRNRRNKNRNRNRGGQPPRGNAPPAGTPTE